MLPSNWNDITIEQYVSVYKTLSEEPKDAEAQLNLLIKRTCLLTFKEPEWVEDNLTMSDLAKMQDFLKSPLPTKLIKNFRFNGKRYTVDIDPTKYDAGRYMSVMNQLKDSKIDNLHKVIFLVCREVNFLGQTVDVPTEEIVKDMEAFKQLPLKVANPIAVFFWTLYENLTDVTLKYSTDQMQTANELIQQELDYLESSGG